MPRADDALVRALEESGVARQADLADLLHLSPKSLQRRLRHVAHLRSLNHNAAFLTLASTPRFDQFGLWAPDGVCFSRHGGLTDTLRSLIDLSPDGQTRQQLQALVLTTVHNHLSRLLRQQAISSFVLDRLTVYASADRQRCRQQEAARRPPPPAPADATRLPPGLDALAVLRVLLRRLQAPDASAASVAKSLQAQRLAVTAGQVRLVSSFYGLEKKDTTR
jgi:hypothetical protein